MRSRAQLAAAAAVVVALLGLAACGGEEKSTAKSSGKFDTLAVVEDDTRPAVFKALADGPCASEAKAKPISTETLPLADLDTRLQLLTGQDALPTAFAAGGTPEVTQQLGKAGKLVDFEKALDGLGVLDQVEPAAISTIKSLYGGRFEVLPFEFAVEGFWYNKKLFADAGVQVPRSWDELVAAAKVFAQEGLQPFATGAAGQGWPVTRLISGYIQREVGPDAFADVRDGKAKLTDPDYVAGAQAIADLGKAGYLGKAVESVDYNGVITEFLTGKAPMIYMGSWILSDFADKSRNQVGSENIGFFPFPAVDGGAGSVDQLPANVGVPWSFASKRFDASAKSWLTCIAKNWGEVALKSKGTISGFKVNGDVPTDPLTNLVREEIAKLDRGLVWFETYFGPRASDVAWKNVAPMVNGQISAKDFMNLVQKALDAEK